MQYILNSRSVASTVLVLLVILVLVASIWGWFDISVARADVKEVTTTEAFTPYLRSTYRTTLRGLRYKLREHADNASRYMRHIQRRYGLSLGF